jgi:hypothetical protein
MPCLFMLQSPRIMQMHRQLVLTETQNALLLSSSHFMLLCIVRISVSLQSILSIYVLRVEKMWYRC